LIFFFLFLSSYFPRLFDFFAVEEKLGKRKAPIRVDRRCWGWCRGGDDGQQKDPARAAADCGWPGLFDWGSVGWWCAVASPSRGAIVWMSGLPARTVNVLAGCLVCTALGVGQLAGQRDEQGLGGFDGQAVQVGHAAGLDDEGGGVGLQGVVAAGVGHVVIGFGIF
jgi:hypothetical protein